MAGKPPVIAGKPPVMAGKPPVKVPEDEDEGEELVDPLDTLKDKCAERKKCAALQAKLDECNDRVSSKKKTAESCEEELIDFVHCVDHCLVKDLFKMLK